MADKADFAEAILAFKKIANPRAPLYIGIDPGAEGAIGIICDGEALVLDIPTYKVEVTKTVRVKPKGPQLSPEVAATLGTGQKPSGKKQSKIGHRTEFNLPAIVALFRMLREELGALPVATAVALEHALVQTARPVKDKEGKLTGEKKVVHGLFGAFRTGAGWGMWPLFLAQLGYTVEDVYPLTWKKRMGVTSKKGTSLRKARSLWPRAPLTRQSDHNRAEALLLAEYVRRQCVGGG